MDDTTTVRVAGIRKGAAEFSFELEIEEPIGWGETLKAVARRASEIMSDAEVLAMVVSALGWDYVLDEKDLATVRLQMWDNFERQVATSAGR